MSTKKPPPLIPDRYIRFIFGIIVFSALISGGTYYLQSSLILLKAFGLFAHWAAILILLPVLSGLVQHLIAPPARLLVPILGALASSTIRSLELALSIISIIAGIWGTLSLGLSALK